MSTSSTSAQSDSHFELVTQFYVQNILVQKFRSRRTGQTVIHAQVDGPLVNGFFVLSTESFEHSGLPHTLEHIIFMGSQDYPYKGVLDQIANRCYAQGTNAWTDTDHTCYTVTCAGEEGFLNMLYVYVDHILFPTITDASFTTEVHHINPEGEDAGVVYCEMQGRENTAESLIARAFLETMYAGTGYASETGGKMKDLRDLTAERVRTYHRNYYRAENFCSIITGTVDLQKLFQIFDKIDEKIFKDRNANPLPPFQRPWTTNAHQFVPLKENVDMDVKFPSDDEKAGGALLIAWSGPSVHEREKSTAFQIIWKYLAESSVSAIRKNLIDISHPYASDVSPSSIETILTSFYVKFRGVEIARMKELEEKFFALLDSLTKQPLDSERLQALIKTTILKFYSKLEDNPHETIAWSSIGEVLYGAVDGSELRKILDPVPIYQELAKKPDQYWIDLIKEMVTSPRLVIHGLPNSGMSEELAQNEAQRIKEQRETLGNEKLTELGKQLQKAMEQNEIPVPKELIESFPVPHASGITLFSFGSIQFGSLSREHRTQVIDYIVENEHEKTERQELQHQLQWSNPEYNKIPFLQLDNVPSAFVEFHFCVDSGSLPEKFRPYIELYSEIVFQSPVERNGVLVPFHEIVRELNNETISRTSSVGFSTESFGCGLFSDLVNLSFKFERTKYETVLKLALDILWHTRFTAEVLTIGAKKLLNDVTTFTRKADKMLRTLTADLHFTSQSNHHALNVYRQERFLQDLLARLEKNEKEVENEFATFTKLLLPLSNLRFHVVAKAEGLPLATLPKQIIETATTASFVSGNEAAANKQELVTYAANYLKANNQDVIAGLGATESGFLTQTIRVPSSYNDPIIAPLMVAIEYLTMLEGPFWTKIRGLGLAYHYYVQLKPEEGLMVFLLGRANSLHKAWVQAQNIILTYSKSEEVWQQLFLDSARSTLISGIISREETISAAALQRFLSNLKHLDNRALLQRVDQVTLETVRQAFDTYLRDLFLSAEKTTTAVIVHPSKVTIIQKQFQSHTVDKNEDDEESPSEIAADGDELQRERIVKDLVAIELNSQYFS